MVEDKLNITAHKTEINNDYSAEEKYRSENVGVPWNVPVRREPRDDREKAVRERQERYGESEPGEKAKWKRGKINK